MIEAAALPDEAEIDVALVDKGRAGDTCCITDAGACEAATVDVTHLRVGATISENDALFFCLRTDAGLTAATALLAAWILLHARGVDHTLGAQARKLADETRAARAS